MSAGKFWCSTIHPILLRTAIPIQRNIWPGIAADNDIDLVLSAHDHIYSRAAFMNRDCESYNDYDYEPGSTVVNPEGTLYVTCGTSSGCLYHEPDPDIRVVFVEKEHFPVAMRFDITEQELHFQTYRVDNWTVCDEYTIRKD